MAAVVALVWASAATAGVFVLLKSLQRQGARGLHLEGASSGDTSDYQGPELRLNICLVCEVFMQILATGVGTLAFIWATVVLLGGSSNLLHKVDFWVITGIVFVQAAKVVGLNSNTEAKFFAEVPPALLELGAAYFTGRERPLTGDASGSSCIGLSIFRLFAITRHKQYRPGSGADGSNISNVLRALIFFYILVLAQGGLFIFWQCILVYRSVVREQVCSEYHFEGKDKVLIDKYIGRTSSECIRTGVLNTINRKLVSFAIDLLHSEYREDHVSGVQVLHTLTSVANNRTHNERAIAQIQSSPYCVARMFVLLSSKSAIDEDSKINLAGIVTKISSKLRLSDIDGSMESISSLIDPCLTKISTPANSVSNGQQQGINSSQSPSIQNGENNHPLIIHGLMILAKLAGNPDNCTRIFSTKDLFPKIIAPISNKLYAVFTDETGIAIEITEKSLRVVSKLVKGTDKINRDIGQEICRKGLALDGIHPILTLDQRYNSLKVPAIKILSELDLVQIHGNGHAMADYIHHLMGLLDSDQSVSMIKKAAAKALVLLLATDSSRAHCATIMNCGHPVLQKLSDMLSDDSDPSYRNAVAQLLTQFCVHSTYPATRAFLKTILHKVLNVIICEVDQALGITNQQSNSQHQNRSRAEVILHFCVPCVDTSSFASRGSRQGVSQTQDLAGNNGGNRRSTPATPVQLLQALFPCLATSSPANQSGGGGNTLPNQTVAGSQNQSDEGPVRRIILSVLDQLYRLVNLPGAYYSNIRGNHVKTQPASTPIKAGSRKTLVAFLALAFQICDKLSDREAADHFNGAVAQITDLSGETLVERFDKIIAMCNKDVVGLLKGRGPSVDYLMIIKSTTKLCAWVMQKNESYVAYFQQKEVDKKLEGALEAMRGLELGVLLTCSTDQLTNYETLSSIVEKARNLMKPPQTTPPPPPPQ